MCGRARCSLSREEVRAAAKVNEWRNEGEYSPSYNVAPGKNLPVLKQGPVPELSTMKWGLVPSYTKAEEKPNFFRMFNARSETVASKGVFKKLLNKQRCIIFTNGFYEWKQEIKQKQPYFIHLEGQDVMRMAGLFDIWHGPGDEKMLSTTILTTDSSERLQWLHDRMPVLLPTDESAQAWLAGDESDVILAMKTLCKPYNGEDLQWYPVDTKMSNMKEDGAECCRPLKRKSISTFFKAKTGPTKKQKTIKNEDESTGAVKSEPQDPTKGEKVLQERDLAQIDSMHAPDGAKLAEEDIKQETSERDPIPVIEIKEEGDDGQTNGELQNSTPDREKSLPKSEKASLGPLSAKRKQGQNASSSAKKSRPMSSDKKGTITSFFAKNPA